MKKIKISYKNLILAEEYDKNNVILTSYFSADFDKILLESFEKHIHSKIKSLILQNTSETIVREKYVKKIEEYKEDIKSFQIRCRKLKKMLSELQNKMIKIRQRDDSEYEEEYMREQRTIFRKFFNKNRRIKEIIRYNDSVDLFRLSFLIKKKNEDNWKNRLNNEVKKMKKKLKKLKKSDPHDVISINFRRPFAYYNFLIALLTNSGLNIKISKVKPYKDSDVNTEEYLKMMIEFKAIEVYSNFIKLVEKKQEELIKIIDFATLDSEHFLLLDCKKEEFEEKFNPSKKHTLNLIEYIETESNLGFRIQFNKLFKEIWLKFKEKSHKKESSDKINGSKRNKGYKRKKRLSLKKSISTDIGVSVVIAIIILAFFPFSPKPIYIEQYDEVDIHYTVWESNESKKYESYRPIHNSTIRVYVKAINDTNLAVLGSGLILGLYNNLLGKELYYESDNIWLNRCIDEDCDGYDDLTGQLALTCGKRSMQYFNTCLIIHFKVLFIKKNNN